MVRIARPHSRLHCVIFPADKTFASGEIRSASPTETPELPHQPQQTPSVGGGEHDVYQAKIASRRRCQWNPASKDASIEAHAAGSLACSYQHGKQDGEFLACFPSDGSDFARGTHRRWRKDSSWDDFL